MSTIKLRRSSVPNRVPTSAQLSDGEVAINTHDGKMYFRRDVNGDLSIREVGLADRTDNVLYVTVDGDDTNNGTTIAEAFATLNAALAVATADTTIFLKSGTHTLNNDAGGVNVPTNVSIIGDNLRSCSLKGSTPGNDLLYMNNGVYVAGITFRNHISPAAAISYNPDGSAGTIYLSPYVQNCTSYTTTGTGMRIDGSYVSGLRSMVSDAFTQINSGGIGVHILNSGYAQLVSIFTVCCEDGILCQSGGQCSVTNSNCSFGTYGLRSEGKGTLLYGGTSTTEATINSNVVTLDGLSVKPKFGDVAKFDGDNFYYTVETSTNLVGGTGFTPGVGTTYDPATGLAVLEIGAHTIQVNQEVTIETNSLTFTCDLDNHATQHTYPRPTDPAAGAYLTVLAVTATSITVNVGASPPEHQYAHIFVSATANAVTGFPNGATSTVVFDEAIEQTNPIGTTVNFYKRSLIAASSITMEYVGSGTRLSTALPQNGGVPNQENEVVDQKSTNEGRVYYTSTDHKGDFRIGNDLLIDAGSGTINGVTFDRSLFAIMTPYILALES